MLRMNFIRLCRNQCLRNEVQRNKYTYVKVHEAHERNVGDSIQVKGWVYNFRKQSKFYFFDLKDGSTNERLQVMIDKEVKKQNPDLGYGVSVVVDGVIGTAPHGHLELRSEHLKLVGKCPKDDGDYPFNRKQNHSNDYIRQYLHLRAHSDKFKSIFRVRHLASKCIHQFFDENNFYLMHPPILTSNACEGAGELFSVQPANTELLASMQPEKEKKPDDKVFYDRKVYLTLSGQLHLEAMCQRMGAVYSFGPIFRAEKTSSTIHMSEFYMIETEEAFVDGIEDLTRRIESFTKNVTTNLLNRNSKEIHEAIELNAPENEKVDIEKHFEWLQKPFETLTYAQASDILQKHKSNFVVAEGLSKSDELFLVEHLQCPVFVINWPKSLKPFYMRTCKDDPNLVEAVDFLMPMVGELAGGSVREDNYETLAKVIPNNLEWYRDLRKYGSCPTGGFGIGFDRYLQVLLGIRNIKDTIPFPRWPKHCEM